MTNDEPAYVDEPPKFWYSASLRIYGNIPDLDQIGRSLGLDPTHVHRRSDVRMGSGRYRHDMWYYDAPVDRSEPLHVHIDALWSAIRGQKEYLLQLKKEVNVDVFLAYTSDSASAGVKVPHSSLEMFMELEVPFGLSIVVI